jgi:hypothetical protein
MGRRLARQHLLDPAADLVATASRLGGVHAQVASGAALIVGIRTTGSAATDIDDALWQRRSLVKTWGMRGTLHLFPADELPTWVAAFRQRQWPRFTPGWERYHGVTADDLRRITDAVGQVLPGRMLTRDELAIEIAAVLGAPELVERIRSGWGVMLKPAAAGGLLCFGPERERNVTFTDPHGWLPEVRWGEIDPDAAMREIVCRFLDTYGPASHEDFGRWWGTDAASARRIFAAHSDAMVQVDVDGRKTWLPAESVDASSDEARGVLLLPGFDPYVVAPISARAYSVPDGYVDRVSRTAGWISAVLVVDGVVRGTWTHELAGGRLAIEVAPFGRITRAVRTTAEEYAQRYATLLGTEVAMTWT